MTDRPDPDPERRFEPRLRHDLEVGVRPVDREETARAAIAHPGRSVGRVLIGVATVLVAGAVSLAALQWLAPLGSRSGGSQPTASSPQPTAPTSAGNLDPTGILLVGVGEHVQAGPASEALRDAFDQALRFAQAHPDDIGYPWIDPSTDELVLSAATEKGRSFLGAEAATVAVPHRIRDVAHAYAELQQIQDEVTFLSTEGVTDAQLIYMTYPDQRDNRTLITISRMSHPLLEELARRFGADAIAVQVDPNQPRAGTDS